MMEVLFGIIGFVGAWTVLGSIVWLIFDKRRRPRAAKVLVCGLFVVALGVSGIGFFSETSEQAAVAASPANAIKAVETALGTNHLDIKPADLKAMSNPEGEGVFVYVPKTRFFGARRNILWMVIDGQAYSLNGATKGVTPNLPWPREAPDSVWARTNLDKFSSIKALRLVFGDDF